MICAGIDSGSRTVKVVLLEAASRRVVDQGIVDQGVGQEALAMGLLDRLLSAIRPGHACRATGGGRDRRELAALVATGYGRNAIRAADDAVTEITCQGRGVRHVLPAARTVIDIGGQDSKLLKLDSEGAVQDFAANDRCAAGTGGFLELVAGRLGVSLRKLGELARAGAAPAAISSTCAVFAETEIIGLLAAGNSPESVAAGVLAAVAARTALLAGGRLDEPVVFTGGVALVPGMDAALQAALGRPVRIAPDPQMTAALGAAILACESDRATQRRRERREG